MLKPFFVWENRKLKRIDPAEVACLVADKNYTKIWLRDGTEYMVRATLTNALKKLPPDMFIKIHRAAVASVYFMDSISRDHLMAGIHTIPIGKQYYKSLINKLNIIE